MPEYIRKHTENQWNKDNTDAVKAVALEQTDPSPYTAKKIKIYLSIFLPFVGIYFLLNKNSPFTDGEKAVFFFISCMYILKLAEFFGIFF